MTSAHLTLEEALHISALAFLPYQCATSVNAEDASFALSVQDEAGTELLSVPHIARSQYSDPIHLAGTLELARLELSKDGYALEPWSMPFQVDLDLP
jgi:hypothetical protein